MLRHVVINQYLNSELKTVEGVAGVSTAEGAAALRSQCKATKNDMEHGARCGSVVGCESSTILSHDQMSGICKRGCIRDRPFDKFDGPNASVTRI